MQDTSLLEGTVDVLGERQQDEQDTHDQDQSQEGQRHASSVEPPAWHRHENLACSSCGGLVFLRATCARRGWPFECPLPSIVLCLDCRSHQ